jgi:5-methylcytosine-specific restriction endonuclease McrA
MVFDLKPWNRNIADDELLADLRRVAAEMSKSTVSYKEYYSRGRCRSRIFESRFGSWNEALVRAGLQVSLRQNVPVEELFDNLRAVWEKLGRQPRREEMRSPLSKFSKGCYQRRFRGWRNALEHFIAWVNEDQSGNQSQDIQAVSFVESNRSPRFPSLRMRFQVFQRDNFRCCACGKSPAMDLGVELHADHIIAWASGGLTELGNLQTLCNTCNYGKGATTANANAGKPLELTAGHNGDSFARRSSPA